MITTRRRVRALLGLALALAAVAAYRSRVARASGYGDALAWTECPFIGEPKVTVTGDVDARDTLPVRRHEEVHAQQCRDLGPWRYRLRNLTAGGRLALETPGYCAGAAARLMQGEDTSRVRERLLDDASSAFRGALPADDVRRALRRSCRTLAP